MDKKPHDGMNMSVSLRLRIAVLEDDPMEARLIQQTLEDAGHECSLFHLAGLLIESLEKERFDLVILDWHLPDMTGDQVVGWIRQTHGEAPVVMFLTSRALEENIVEGLMAGADDYMTKPIRQAELNARIHALSKRARKPDPAAPAPAGAASLLVCGVFELDLVIKRASVRGQPVELKPKEFAIAAMLFQNLGQIVSREKIVENVWGRELVTTSRTLDTHMSQVRTKLQLKRDNNVRLTTIYTIGYRLDVCT